MTDILQQIWMYKAVTDIICQCCILWPLRRLIVLSSGEEKKRLGVGPEPGLEMVSSSTKLHI